MGTLSGEPPGKGCPSSPPNPTQCSSSLGVPTLAQCPFPHRPSPLGFLRGGRWAVVQHWVLLASPDRVAAELCPVALTSAGSLGFRPQVVIPLLCHHGDQAPLPVQIRTAGLRAGEVTLFMFLRGD